MNISVDVVPGRAGLRANRIELSHGDRIVLDGVDISAAKGEVTALVGPNGAGKSTLLRLIAGAGRASSGEIALDGVPIGRMRRREWAQRTALIEQEWSAGDGLTARQLVELGRLPHQGWLRSDSGAGVVDQSLEQAGAAEYADQLVQTLSGGERQRVNVARALAQQPALLLCDEPTNHLDIRAQLSVLGLLRRLAQGGISVMIALHDLNHAAAFADHVVVLVDGSVRAAGSVADVLTVELIAEVWGVRVEVLKRAHHARPSILFETDASEVLS